MLAVSSKGHLAGELSHPRLSSLIHVDPLSFGSQESLNQGIPLLIPRFINIITVGQIMVMYHGYAHWEDFQCFIFEEKPHMELEIGSGVNVFASCSY